MAKMGLDGEAQVLVSCQAALMFLMATSHGVERLLFDKHVAAAKQLDLVFVDGGGVFAYFIDNNWIASSA
jgi:hypothetical protein